MIVIEQAISQGIEGAIRLINTLYKENDALKLEIAQLKVANEWLRKAIKGSVDD